MVRRYQLTARDRRVLYAIGRMGQVTAEQVRRLFFGSDMSTVFRRLRKLVALGLLRCFVTSESERNLYVLSAAGHRLLVESGVDAAELHRARVGRHRDLHLERLNDVRVELVLAARAGRGLELRAFHGDLDLRRAAGSAPPQYVPDAIGEVVTPAGPLALVIEIDLGSEGLSVFRRKVEATVDLWQAGARCWGAEAGSWRPVAFVPSGTRARAVARTIVAAGGGALWLVAELGRLRNVGALGPILATADEVIAAPPEQLIPYRGALTDAPAQSGKEARA